MKEQFNLFEYAKENFTSNVPVQTTEKTYAVCLTSSMFKDRFKHWACVSENDKGTMWFIRSTSTDYRESSHTEIMQNPNGLSSNAKANLQQLEKELIELGWETKYD